MTHLRAFLRRWLGIDDDRDVNEAATRLHASAIGSINDELRGIRWDLGERGKALYLGRDDRPYSDADRKAAVDGLLGEDGQ